VCGGRKRTRALTAAHPDRADHSAIAVETAGARLAARAPVIWFLEKKNDLLVCEIRRSAACDGYEFEIADAAGPTTIRCQTPTELIARYLHVHSRLMRDGWRPRPGNVNGLE
jgi:hypothetical protein